jgi:hypothetical protein
MHVAVRAAILVAAVAGAAIEVWAVRAGWSWAAAALDLLAGWSLLAAAGWAVNLTGGCRGLIGLSGTFWFLATPQVVGGTAGHAAALFGGAWLGPLATALLGSPRWGRGTGRHEARGQATRHGQQAQRHAPGLMPFGESWMFHLSSSWFGCGAWSRVRMQGVVERDRAGPRDAQGDEKRWRVIARLPCG